jgi:hypothetical protein
MTEGFCYVADEPGYVREAVASATSLKKQMPDARVALICPAELFTRNGVFDHYVVLEKGHSGPIIKAQAIAAPFDRVMLVDTDTLIARDLSDSFRILDHFDLAAAHEPTRGWDYPCDAPPAFCELNTGVLLFANNAQIRSLFGHWIEKYYEFRQAYGLLNDQPAFRATIWAADHIRIATLPSEFHCIVGKPVSIAWEARLLHGRGDLVSIEHEINARLGYRAFIPGWGQLMGFSGRKNLIRQYCRLTINFLKILLLPKWRADSSAAAPVQWWKTGS